MILKLIKKFIPYLFIAIAFLENAGGPSLMRVKKAEKDASSKNYDSDTKERLQYKSVEKTFYQNSKTLSLKKSAPSLLYRNYDGQKIPNGISQSGQVPIFINASSGTSVMMVVANFDYTVNPINTAINEIKDISINIVNPKSFLAKNLNEEGEEKIDFYSNSPAHSRKI